MLFERADYIGKYGVIDLQFERGNKSDILDLYNMTDLLRCIGKSTTAVQYGEYREMGGPITSVIIKINGGLPDAIVELLNHDNEHVALSVSEEFVNLYLLTPESERAVLIERFVRQMISEDADWTNSQE